MANLRNIKPFIMAGPGDQIKELLSVNDWTQDDLALILGITRKHMCNIVQNKQAITLDIAKMLSKAFEHSPQFWINLDTNYRLQVQQESRKEREAGVLAMLFKHMPVAEMKKRNWISRSSDTEKLLQECKKFWKTDEIGEVFFREKCAEFALRKSESYPGFNMNHALTWLQMANNYADGIMVCNYDQEKLLEISCKINLYSIMENGIGQFIDDIEGAGVKFVYLKHLPKTYIDGAAFWSGDNPVIAYTGRYNRIDHFWFTIAHEIGHVLKHLKTCNILIDDEKLKDSNSRMESEADEFASAILKHNDVYLYFKNKSKRITRNMLESCSEELSLHMGIIVGALAFKNHSYYKLLHQYAGKLDNKIPARFSVDINLSDKIHHESAPVAIQV